MSEGNRGDTVRDVVTTLLIAFVLVVIVVFLFLGTLRATLIPAIAVPVSLIGSFAVLLVMGYSANTMSLLAMVLAHRVVGRSRAESFFDGRLP